MEQGETTVALLDHFADLEDPQTRQSPHGLMELLLTAICAAGPLVVGEIEESCSRRE